MSLTYMLRNRPDGQTELLQFDPRLIAVFPLKADAERVLASLEHHDTLAQAERPAEPEMQPLALNAMSQPAPVEVTPPASGQLAPEPDWERAMTRLAAGEKLRLVAEDMGIVWTVLRGRWAQRSSAQPRSDDAMTNCMICDRPFRPSATSTDKCARCSRD